MQVPSARPQNRGEYLPGSSPPKERGQGARTPSPRAWLVRLGPPRAGGRLDNSVERAIPAGFGGAMSNYSGYGRQLCGQPDPHGESYGPGGKQGYFPRDPHAETWTVPASKNRGLQVPAGFRNEIGHTPSAALLRVDRQMHLDKKAYFRWTGWKARYFGLWGVAVPIGIYLAITNEMVRLPPPARRPPPASPVPCRAVPSRACAVLRAGEQGREGGEPLQAGVRLPELVSARVCSMQPGCACGDSAVHVHTPRVTHLSALLKGTRTCTHARRRVSNSRLGRAACKLHRARVLGAVAEVPLQLKDESLDDFIALVL